MIEFSGVGQLRSPVVVAAFEGWNDAADASSAAVEHLENVFGARVIGAIDPDDYYDFQVNRPTVSGTDGASRKIAWPTTRLSVARPAKSDSDLVLVRGLEPNMRWRGFTDELIEAVHALGSDMVITLGALLADSPHTRPVPISGTAGDPATAARLGLEASRYEGPTGIVGVFADACSRAELASVSFWAAVPHYVANPPCPKATLALLRRVEDLLDMEIPLGELPDKAKAWERQVDELAAGDTEVAEYVRSLESREPETALPEASGDAIAREFERYLRRRGE
ncbi:MULTISPECIES: PAC2 family protein [Parafrankia]|uniref:PAC2 family protein n=1 Tax=Parafrankia TaxID=2994362 RepID=UPI0003711758|nr:PAC2 family protein [Parafrankia elaeagni]